MEIIIAADIDQFITVESITTHWDNVINNIYYLNLVQDDISYIPKELFNMTNIKYLSLTGLLVNGIFPNKIINMQNVVILYANSGYSCKNKIGIRDISLLRYLKKLRELMIIQDEIFELINLESSSIMKFSGTFQNRLILEKATGRKL